MAPARGLACAHLPASLAWPSRVFSLSLKHLPASPTCLRRPSTPPRTRAPSRAHGPARTRAAAHPRTQSRSPRACPHPSSPGPAWPAASRHGRAALFPPLLFLFFSFFSFLRSSFSSGRPLPAERQRPRAHGPHWPTARPFVHPYAHAALYTCTSSVSYATTATSSAVGPQNATPVSSAWSQEADSRHSAWKGRQGGREARVRACQGRQGGREARDTACQGRQGGREAGGGTCQGVRGHVRLSLTVCVRGSLACHRNVPGCLGAARLTSLRPVAAAPRGPTLAPPMGSAHTASVESSAAVAMMSWWGEVRGCGWRRSATRDTCDTKNHEGARATSHTPHHTRHITHATRHAPHDTRHIILHTLVGWMSMAVSSLACAPMSARSRPSRCRLGLGSTRRSGRHVRGGWGRDASPYICTYI
jgi:hypothetical protein